MFEKFSFEGVLKVIAAWAVCGLICAAAIAHSKMFPAGSKAFPKQTGRKPKHPYLHQE